MKKEKMLTRDQVLKMVEDHLSEEGILEAFSSFKNSHIVADGEHGVSYQQFVVEDTLKNYTTAKLLSLLVLLDNEVKVNKLKGWELSLCAPWDNCLSAFEKYMTTTTVMTDLLAEALKIGQGQESYGKIKDIDPILYQEGINSYQVWKSAYSNLLLEEELIKSKNIVNSIIESCLEEQPDRLAKGLLFRSEVSKLGGLSLLVKVSPSKKKSEKTLLEWLTE